MFVVKFGRAIKNNPKKSIAGAVVLAWVGKWVEKKYNAHVFRRAECQNAVRYGRESLNQFHNPKRVTVFLNPAANDGKAMQMYEKYAAPILHLAGYNVHMVRLSYEGEAKQLMSVIGNDDTDLIVCGGGDGTLSEIVTGLLRRDDSTWKKIPIAVLPLGKNNTMCRRLIPDADTEKQPHFICSAATAITHNQTIPVDVMQVKGSQGKTVYAVSNIRWGTYCDLQERSKKMWYFAGLKSYMPFVFSLPKSNPYNPRMFNISYTDPGDVPEYMEAEETPLIQPTITGTSIISKFFYRLWPWKSAPELESTVTEEEVKPPPEYSENLQDWHEIPRNSIEFYAEANTHLNSSHREKASVNVTVESDTVDWKDFVSKGPYKVQNVTHSPVNVSEQFEADSFNLSSVVNEDSKQYISIDNDRYDAMDISVKLLPNCIKMIHCSNS